MLVGNRGAGSPIDTGRSCFLKTELVDVEIWLRLQRRSLSAIEWLTPDHTLNFPPPSSSYSPTI